MNIRLNLLLFILIVFIAGCASGGSKFIGKWRPIKPRDLSSRSLLVIEKSGKNYDSYILAVPEKSTRFDYDKEHDYLTVKMGQHTINIIYLDSTGHIRMILVKGKSYPPGMLEFEKAEGL